MWKEGQLLRNSGVLSDELRVKQMTMGLIQSGRHFSKTILGREMFSDIELMGAAKRARVRRKERHEDSTGYMREWGDEA